MYLAKPFFSSLKNCVVYIAIYVAYLAKPLLLDYLTMFETNRLKSKFLYCTGRLLNCSSSKIFTRVAQYYLSCIYLDPARTSSLESVILIVNSTSNKWSMVTARNHSFGRQPSLFLANNYGRYVQICIWGNLCMSSIDVIAYSFVVILCTDVKIISGAQILTHYSTRSLMMREIIELAFL